MEMSIVAAFRMTNDYFQIFPLSFCHGKCQDVHMSKELNVSFASFSFVRSMAQRLIGIARI